MSTLPERQGELKVGENGPNAPPQADSGSAADTVVSSSSSKLPCRRVTGGVASRQALLSAITQASARGIGIEEMLGTELPLAEVGQALSEFYGCPFISFEPRQFIAPELFRNLKLDYLRRHHWVPIRKEGHVVQVAMDNPADLRRIQDIRYAFPGCTVQPAVALRRDIERVLDRLAGEGTEQSIPDILGELVREIDQEKKPDSGGDAIDENNSAIVRLTNQIIAEAYRMGASDIHLEPYGDRKETVVRFRVEGACATFIRIPAAYRRAVVSRIKIMANLDIAERRKPQDGKIRFKNGQGNEIELRVATLPTTSGNEDVVMRILTAKSPLPLTAMDLPDPVISSLKQVVEKPYGIVLCVGPTGSGKTTTLHALLAQINTDQRKIWTVEDPVEITQEGLRQLQVQPKIGLTFATALRAFLRADPDVIMVGEMRDKETADIAIEASLTGHLVFSTLHTNSAVETVTRILDMGCDSFNFADAVLAVLAKRLCKRLCLACKEAYEPMDEERRALAHAYGIEEWAGRMEQHGGSVSILWRPRGCDECNGTGFKGRVGLCELLLGSDTMKRLIQSHARTHELRQCAKAEGMISLVQDGIDKVLRGDTTLQEVKKVALR
ncbi:MAG TPA: GspE/PulE family protein [Nitrospiraceae bacterium]|nr:GspE/PulE family protein [Nitrospiraceae bacterium]